MNLEGESPMEHREQIFQTINRIAVPLFLAFNLGVGLWNTLQRRWYYAALGFGFLLLPLLLRLFYQATKRRRCHQLDFLVYVFAFLLYTVGLALRWYAFVPYYDKAAHTLSGVALALFGLLLFHFLSPEKSMEAARFPLAAAFVMAVVAGAGGLWEIGEYAISLLFRTDPQNVLTTGVSDTMLDMIVCNLGGLAVLPSLYAYMKRGKRSFLLGVFHTVAMQKEEPAS